MAKCPVSGCERKIPLGARAQARQAARFETYLPVLRRLADLAVVERPDGDILDDLLTAGAELSRDLHRAAHGEIYLPGSGVTPGVLESWKSTAEPYCQEVAMLDPGWANQYWADVRARGLTEPWALMAYGPRAG